MRLSRRRFLAGAAAVLAAGVPAARAQSLTKVKFTLPWLPHGGFTHYFVARKQGLWEKRGLDVSIDRGFGSGEVCKTVGLGQYDFGEIDFGVMTNCAAKNLRLIGLGLIQPKATMGIFALARKGIRKPRDLEGRKVGFATGSGDFQLWPAFVKANGIDDGKVQKVFMGPPALIKALIEEQIDAEGNFYGSIAPSVWAQGLELTAMLYADHGVPIYGLAMATRPDVVKEKPQVVAAFVDGAYEALAWTYFHPEQAVDIHLESVKEFAGSPTNRDVIRHGQGVRTAMALVPEFEKQGLGAFDPAMVEKTRETVAAYMGAPEVPPADQLYTSAFAGKVKLTAAQWAQVRESVKRYIPSRA